MYIHVLTGTQYGLHLFQQHCHPCAENDDQRESPTRAQLPQTYTPRTAWHMRRSTERSCALHSQNDPTPFRAGSTCPPPPVAPPPLQPAPLRRPRLAVTRTTGVIGRGSRCGSIGDTSTTWPRWSYAYVLPRICLRIAASFSRSASSCCLTASSASFCTLKRVSGHTVTNLGARATTSAAAGHSCAEGCSLVAMQL